MSVTFRIPELSTAYWAQDEMKRVLESHRQLENSVLKSVGENLTVGACARAAMEGVTRGLDIRELARISDTAHMVESLAMVPADDVVGERDRILDEILKVRSAYEACGAPPMPAMHEPMTAFDACGTAGMMSHVSTISSFKTALQQIGDAEAKGYRTLANGSSISETIEAISHLQIRIEPWQTDLRSMQEFIGGMATTLPDTASIISRLSAVNGYSNLHSGIRHAMGAPADVPRWFASSIEQLDDLSRLLSTTFGLVANTSDLEALVASSRISEQNIEWVSKFEGLVECIDQDEQEAKDCAAPTSLPNEQVSPALEDDPRTLATQLTIVFIPIQVRLRTLSRRVAIDSPQRRLTDMEMIALIAGAHPEIAAQLLGRWNACQNFVGMIKAPRGRLKSGAKEEMEVDDWKDFRRGLDAIESILDSIDPSDSAI